MSPAARCFQPLPSSCSIKKCQFPRCHPALFMIPSRYTLLSMPIQPCPFFEPLKRSFQAALHGPQNNYTYISPCVPEKRHNTQMNTFESLSLFFYPFDPYSPSPSCRKKDGGNYASTQAASKRDVDTNIYFSRSC